MGKIKSKLTASLRSDKLKSTAISALLIGVIIAVNIIIYTVTAVFGLYFSPSAENYDLSLSGATDILFSDAISRGEKVTVMFCRSIEEMPQDLAANTDELGIFYLTAKNFEDRYKGFIELEFVNILTHVNNKQEVVPLEKYQNKDDNGDPYPIYRNSVIFVSGGRYKTVSDITTSAFIYDENVSSSYYSSYCGEEVFASLAMQVLDQENKKVQFTTLHSEQVDSAFGSILSCAGYELDTVNLRREEIDEDTDIIVISNPQTDFERAAEGSLIRSEIEKLREFAGQEGKSIYVALDPYVEKLPSLEGFLKECGISYYEQEINGKLLREIIKDNDNAITMDRVTIVANIYSDEENDAIANTVNKYTSSGVILSHCARLKLEGSAEPLLVTSASASAYAGDKQTDSSGNYCIGARAKYIDEKGKECGNIIMVPSIYLTANDALHSSGYANREFMYSVAEHIFGSESVPIGCNIIHFNTGVLQNLTARMMRIYTALVFVIPAVIAVVGTVVVVRRKNR